MTTASGATPRSVTSKDATTDNRSGRVLALVLAAQFMALLDTFIVNVAAPTIQSELGSSGAGLQLVVAGCTITYAVLLITGAGLGDLLGHGRAHLAGLFVFTAASLACGLAAGTGQLIAFRLVQGAAAAVKIPQVLSLIQRHFSGEARVRALVLGIRVLPREPRTRPAGPRLGPAGPTCRGWCCSPSPSPCSPSPWCSGRSWAGRFGPGSA